MAASDSAAASADLDSRLGHTSATAEYVVDHDYCFCQLSYYGAKNAEQASDRYWELVARKGRDDNPYRFSFLQLIGVAATDAEAEDLYAEHAEYFFHKLLHTPQYYQAVPGCLEYDALRQALAGASRSALNLRALTAKDFFGRGFVIVGSPKTVREQLMDGIQRLRIGHLLSLLQFGSMPTELCKYNIDLFAREVLPHIAGLWDDRYEDRWWPERLRANRRRRWSRRPERDEPRVRWTIRSMRLRQELIGATVRLGRAPAGAAVSARRVRVRRPASRSPQRDSSNRHNSRLWRSYPTW